MNAEFQAIEMRSTQMTFGANGDMDSNKLLLAV